MLVRRYYIIPQRYPTHDGEYPLSFAAYMRRPFRRDLFLFYAWSRTTARQAMEAIKDDQQSTPNIFTRLRDWLLTLDRKLTVKRQKLDDEKFFNEHVIPCIGCKRKPVLTRFDDNNSHHITCATIDCKDPRWLDCTVMNRSLRQALGEWFMLNTGVNLN